MNMTGADDQPVVAGQTIGQVALVVRDYDEAIHFYVDVLGFALIEDTVIPAQGKRWVVVAPRGSTGSCLLLARAVDDEQASRIGKIRPEAAYFCSSKPTISGVTFTPTNPRASSLSGSQR
jgi:catechol 2,3-dioxygenase-like lactoylglutathione lyase family enzyme